MASTMNETSPPPPPPPPIDLFVDDDVSALTGFASAGQAFSADETDTFGFPTAFTNTSSNNIEAGEGAGGAQASVKAGQVTVRTPPRPSPTNSPTSSPTSVVKTPTRVRKDHSESVQQAVDRTPPRTNEDGGKGAPDPPGDSATIAVAETMIPPVRPPPNSPKGAKLAYMLARASYDAMQDKMLKEKREAAAEAAKKSVLDKEEEEEKESKKITSTDGSTLNSSGRSRSEVETESFIDEIESVHAGIMGGEATSTTKRAGVEVGGYSVAAGLETTFEEEALANEAAFAFAADDGSGDANGANGANGAEVDAVSPLTVPMTTQVNDEEGAGAESSSPSANPFACCGTVLPEGGDEKDEKEKSSGFDLAASVAEFDRVMNGLANPNPNHSANRSVVASTGNADIGAGGDEPKAANRVVHGTDTVGIIPKTGPVDVDEVSQSSMVEEINVQSGAASSGLLISKDGDKKKNQEAEKDASFASVAAAAAAAVVPIAAKLSVLSDGVSKGETEDSTKKSKTQKMVTISERVDEKCFNDTIKDAAESDTISYPDPIPARNSNKSDCISHHTDDASTVVSLQFKVEKKNKKNKSKMTKKPAPISRDASTSSTVMVDNTTGGKGRSNSGSSRKTAFRSLKNKLSSKKLSSASSIVSSASVVGGGPDATIRIISGCAGSQASDNVQNISSFTLPNPAGVTGGAFTSSLLQVLSDADGGKAKAAGASKKKRKSATSKLSYVDVLAKMRSDIKSRGHDQIPQLTASHPVDIAAPFRLQSGKGTARALLVGINYVGEQNELSGCHNDVRNMHRYLTEVAGFDADNVTMLMDDGDCPLPSKANIIETWTELAEDSKAGDSVLFHFSGHGGRVRDSRGSEKGYGNGETIVPVDYKNAGQIYDDDIYNALCKKILMGVTVTCLMDACQSGTVLDLPFVFKADGTDILPKVMKKNKGFNSSKFFFGGTLNQMIAESSNGFCTPPRRRSSNGGKVASSLSTPTTNSSACDDDRGDDAATMVSI